MKNLVLRRKWIVDARLQSDIVKFILFLTMSLVVLFYALIEFFFYRMRLQADALSLPMDHPFYVFIHEQRIFMISLMLLSAFLSLIIAIVAAVYLSNRIAGPIHQIKTKLKEILQLDDNKPLEIQIREKDYFQELVSQINQLLKKNS